MPTWTNRRQPTIDEAAALLPDDARSIRGKARGQTSPAQIHPLTTYAETNGVIYETRTTCYAATVEWEDHNPLTGGHKGRTLIQITRGGLAPDGWATYDTYKVGRLLTEDEASMMIQLILTGVPEWLEGGEL